MSQTWALVVAPLVIHLATALCLAGLKQGERIEKIVSLLGSLSSLLVSLSLLLKAEATQVIASQIGGWAAPFGISFVVDSMSALMLVGLGLVSTVTSFYETKIAKQRVFLHLMYFGCAGAFLTGDLFNLYVWFEVFLMASYALMRADLSKESSGALKNYVVINALGSVMLLIGLGLLFATVGSLNMADVAQKLSGSDDLARVMPMVAFLFVAFLIKAAALPFSSWLVVSYSKATPWCTAIFSALLTKVGLYSLIRVFVLVLPVSQSPLQPVLMWIGILTMIGGVLAAASQFKVLDILSAHIASQIGYIVFAISLGTSLSLAAAIFFLFNQMIVKTGLFLVADAVKNLDSRPDIREQGGLYQRDANFGAAFFVLAMSLAGLPPLSGFAAKIFVFNAALDSKAYLGLAVAAITSFWTLYSMLKIWNEVFAKPSHPQVGGVASNLKLSPKGLMPILVLATLTIIFGLGSGFLMNYASDAASVIVDRNIYIRGVMGLAR
jgi:multicomponent Na+:H+ antiporter subunit D